jgi:hypothetical protein
MPGEYSIDQLAGSGQIGSGLYDQLFGAQDFTGIGDGWNAGNNNWFDQVQLGGDQGWGQGEQTGGFQGNWFDPIEGGTLSEATGQPISSGGTPNQRALDAYKNYTFNYTPESNGAAVLQAYNPQGVLSGTYNQQGPSGMNKFMSVVAPMAATAMFGGALAPAFGGGMLGGALGYGGASGTMAAMRGGDLSQVGKSALSGAIGGAMGGMSQGTPASLGNNPSAYIPTQAGMSPASMAGISNPTMGSMFNAGTGSALSTAATGGNLRDIATNALTSAGTAGINSMGKSMGNSFGDLWNSFSGGGGDAEFDALQGSGGDMSGQTDVSANTYDEAAPEYRFGGEFSQTAQPGMKTAQSYSPDSGGIASFMPSGASVGNYLGSHGGDLAAMLYGFYNNKKQRQALQGQQQGLQDLYSQNSPYAQQLRNTLQAKAAAGGKRLNTGGREVQLQAMLADRAAQMAPTMYQMQQGQNNLQNNNMNMLLQGANKLGAFKAMGNGLQGMFGSSPVMQNASPYQNFMGDYNSLSGGQ